jgi:hypothetical protein
VHLLRGYVDDEHVVRGGRAGDHPWFGNRCAAGALHSRRKQQNYGEPRDGAGEQAANHGGPMLP